MTHSYVNQLIHAFWSTENQQFVIPPSIKNELHAYITSLVNSKNGKVFAIGGSADHVHLLFLLPPEISLAKLIGHIKAYTSKWIKARDSIDPLFSWQQGYSAFSTQGDRAEYISNYIKADENRHHSKKISYLEELKSILKQQEIKYHEQYFAQNTHTKILVHAVWSTYNRSAFLAKEIRPDIFTHIGDVITRCNGKLHAVGGIEDHMHVLMEAPKDKALADVIRDIKTGATHWIKNQDRTKYRDFEWQTGYGGFTISLPSLENVKQYIHGQEEHHRVRSFQDEWKEFLANRGVVQSR